MVLSDCRRPDLGGHGMEVGDWGGLLWCGRLSPTGSHSGLFSINKYTESPCIFKGSVMFLFLHFFNEVEHTQSKF